MSNNVSAGRTHGRRRAPPSYVCFQSFPVSTCPLFGPWSRVTGEGRPHTRREVGGSLLHTGVRVLYQGFLRELGATDDPQSVSPRRLWGTDWSQRSGGLQFDF